MNYRVNTCQLRQWNAYRNRPITADLAKFTPRLAGSMVGRHRFESTEPTIQLRWWWLGVAGDGHEPVGANAATAKPWRLQRFSHGWLDDHTPEQCAT